MIVKTEADVLRAIETAINAAPGSFSMETDAADVGGWDSLGHLNILMALDILFDGRTSNLSELAGATSVPKLMDVLRRHSVI